MAWRKILDEAADPSVSEEIYISQPFALLAEGAFGTRTVTVEMRRLDGTDWIPVDTEGSLVSTDPLLVLGGLPETKYRVLVSSPGLNIYWNIAYPSREA